MPASKKKSPLRKEWNTPQFKQWLLCLTTFCQSLYTDGLAAQAIPYGAEPGNLHDIYSCGVRALLYAFFRQLKETNSLPDDEFEECFLDTKEIGLLESRILPGSNLRNTISIHLNSDPVNNDPDFPGQFYAECLKYCLHVDPGGFVSLKKDKSRRKSGTFYTPASITRYLVRETLSPLFSELKRNERAKIKICDPAMGTGNFLKEAAEQLTDELCRHSSASTEKERSDIYRDVVVNCLYGIDRDPTAVAIARAFFALQAGIEPNRIKNFLSADSLLDELPEEWSFDAVIGNPPWLTYGLRDVKKIPPDLNAVFRRKYPDTAEYKISAYSLFIEKALTITRQGGYHGFIVPDSWLAGRFFSKLRGFLLSRSSFKRIVLIRKDFWKSLHIGRSVIYVVKKTAPGKNHEYIPASVIEAPENLRDVEQKNVTLSVSRIKKRARRRIVVYPDPETRDVVESMEDSGDILGNYLKFYSGLIGKKGKESIVLKGLPGNYSHAKYGRLIESGKNLSRTKLLSNGCYITHDPKLYKSGYDVQKYLEPKIFLNQTGCTLKAFYDDQGFFCLNNMHIAYPVQPRALSRSSRRADLPPAAEKNGIDLRFYAALLNSRILNFYYRVVSMEEGRALAQTDIDFLLQLPHGTDKGIPLEVSSIIKKHQERKVIRHEELNLVEYTSFIPQQHLQEIERLLTEWYGVLHLISAENLENTEIV